MILVVAGALGTIPTRLKGNLNVIGVNMPVRLIQKSALFGSAS